LRRPASWRILLSALTLVSFSLVFSVACGGGGTQGPGQEKASSNLTAAGSTFVAPFFNKVFQQYASDTGTQVNYQSIGSGGGVTQFIDKTIDFGASDAYLTDDEMQRAGGNPMNIAVAGGAVVPAFNLKGGTNLNLRGQVLADIFLGRITKWNDPAIAQDNPNANLPNSDIAVVHRSDGSGTTDIWSNYLSAISPDWKRQVGAGKELSWPTGIGAKGNEGVAGQVTQTPNSLGYIELAYALQNNISMAFVQNASGQFVQPSLESSRAAIESTSIPNDLRIAISATNPTGSDVYPITGLVWALARQQEDDPAKCQAVAQALWYVTHDGQQQAPDLSYVQLPSGVVSRIEEMIKSMQANGEQCYQG
jgi:phosphate transport system substrate-binding protein